MVRPTGNKKAKSKRISLKQKHKVAERVRDHQRKERRLARQEKASGGGNKLKADPGIPNLHPLKPELLRKAEEEKEKLLAEKERQRQRRRAVLDNKRKLTSLESLQADAERRSAEYEELRDSVLPADSAAAATADGTSENSRKAYYKEFKKVVDDADVILEVLDARDPLGCRCKRVEEAVRAAGPGKKLVLLLNKIDLVPKEVVQAWLVHLRRELPTIAFKASTQTQKSNLAQSSKDTISDVSDSQCYGASTLIKLLANYTRNAGIKTAIRVGIVGYPNVGKSSVINSLKRARVVGVAPTPGHTKVVQEVALDSKIKLLDSPGIVFSKTMSDEDLILRNCVKLETLADPVKPVDVILSRCNHAQIMERYVVPAFDSTVTFLQHLARRIGRLKRGGVPDIVAAARVVLQDWNSGKISFYTLPPKNAAPKDKGPISSEVVSQWAAEFDIASLLLEEEDTVMTALVPEKDHHGLVMESAGRMSDDEEEQMEDDAGGAAMEEEKQFITSVKKTHEKEKAGAVAKKGSKKTVEEEINPQLGKDLKKTLKQKKKSERKQAVLDAPAYDVLRDFEALPGQIVSASEEEEEGEDDDQGMEQDEEGEQLGNDDEDDF
eukprot:m.22749 g.22749  ORF g.22749 m.22749 type:complete len:608 (+) comp10941_c0_seq1:108-1931(+)